MDNQQGPTVQLCFDFGSVHQVYVMILVAHGEWCPICDLRRRFSFGTRDQAWSLKSFCIAEFY